MLLLIEEYTTTTTTQMNPNHLYHSLPFSIVDVIYLRKWK